MKATTVTPYQLTANMFLKPLTLSLLIAASAQISIPTPWVPITCQSLVILMIGLLNRPQIATLSILYYLGEIAIGLPFAAGMKGGALVLVGPTAGYLFGFYLASTLGAVIQQKHKKLTSFFVTSTLMTIAIYTPGVLWLSTFVGVEKATQVGLIPFLSEIPAFITIASILSYQLKSLKKD